MRVIAATNRDLRAARTSITASTLWPCLSLRYGSGRTTFRRWPRILWSGLGALPPPCTRIAPQALACVRTHGRAMCANGERHRARRGLGRWLPEDLPRPCSIPGGRSIASGCIANFRHRHQAAAHPPHLGREPPRLQTRGSEPQHTSQFAASAGPHARPARSAEIANPQAARPPRYRSRRPVYTCKFPEDPQ